MLVCHGLKGLSDSITTTWDYAVVQTCILHLIRNNFRYASKRDWDALARNLKPIYIAVNEADAASRFAEVTETWGTLWRRAGSRSS
jgi:putative transposase